MFDPILVWFRDFASRDPDVVALLLFGSVARGVATARSDVDLAFVARSGRARTVDHRLAASGRMPSRASSRSPSGRAVHARSRSEQGSPPTRSSPKSLMWTPP